MPLQLTASESPTATVERDDGQITSSREAEVALLTGCQDPHYAFGLAMALGAAGVRTDIIGSAAEDNPEYHGCANVSFQDLRGNRRLERTIGRKIFGWLLYYGRLLRYLAGARGQLVHILWNNKFELLDRTLLILCYKLLRKKVVLTAHNVNQARRDSEDSWLNRMTLRMQYRLTDHIFVHTQAMKQELGTAFGVHPDAVTVIPYGINNAVRDTRLDCGEAKRRVGVRETDKTVLFFGGIKPYKGLACVVDAFQRLSARNGDYRLIIAGERKKEAAQFFDEIQRKIKDIPDQTRVIQRIQYIPDGETELYFKAADVVALAYKEIFQSGILFLAYSFGLPAVACDVGSFKDDIIEGRTGFLCKPDDPEALANAIAKYFESDLFRELPRRRAEIQAFAKARHSWDTVGEMTRDVYKRILTGGRRHLH